MASLMARKQTGFIVNNYNRFFTFDVRLDIKLELLSHKNPKHVLTNLYYKDS